MAAEGGRAVGSTVASAAAVAAVVAMAVATAVGGTAEECSAVRVDMAVEEQEEREAWVAVA